MWSRKSVLIYFLLCLQISFVQGSFAAEERPGPVSPSRVLVVQNTRSPDAVAISDYYVQKRRIPAANLCRIACPTGEQCAMKEYQERIATPIKQYLAKNRLDVDFIVLTKGIPIRTNEGPAGGFAVDSILAMLDWTLLTDRIRNPYFGRKERFSHKKFQMYLVTRLDGYTRADCLRLVDNALAAGPEPGMFLLNLDPVRNENKGYKLANDGILRAHQMLSRKKYAVRLEKEGKFVGGYKTLMGYFSWGSNDFRYDKKAYQSLGFRPGALAETVVSSSGRTFTDRNNPGQSLIADLIAQGVTGCKGYVSEPYVDSIAHADILFDRYTSGYTLAESFYMASFCAYWKDVVIGDPLCAPYAAGVK